MGKGPSVSQERAEIGRHSWGGGLRHHCQRADTRARQGSGKDSGSR